MLVNVISMTPARTHRGVSRHRLGMLARTVAFALSNRTRRPSQLTSRSNPLVKATILRPLLYPR
jgi:hypothetical protein